MNPLAPPAPASETPELFEEGHLWIQELVVGAPIRFQLESTGRIAFADRERRLEDPPPSLRATVRHVREHLDRESLLAVADDPAAVVFCGVATRFEGVDYDWGRLPPFLGTDVWSTEREAYLAPDVVERSFEQVGLTPVNAVEKEVQAAYFDPTSYDLPASAWYDGPAAGVVIRNKRGGRAAIRGEIDRTVDEMDGSPETVAEAVISPERVERSARAAGDDFDAVLQRVLDDVYREEHGRLAIEDEDQRAFRTAVVERVSELLGE